jgi:hypothetical protein
MAGKSDYLENKILDHILGGGDYTRPATLYVALYTAAPTDAGGGTEVTGGSYARLAVTNDATNFPAAAGGTKSNGTAFEFPEATASWGEVVAFGLLDAAVAGNLLMWNNLNTPKTIDDGDTARFKAGELDFTED